MTGPGLRLRPATEADLPDAAAIFNDAILNTTGSFDSEPKPPEALRPRLASGDRRWPMIVAERDGRIAGWANIGPYSDRCAYGDTGEVSIYVAPGCKGQGVGTALLADLLERARAGGLHTLIARIGEGNPASLALHRRAGFEEVGTLRQIGFKFGRRLDVQILQAMLR